MRLAAVVIGDIAKVMADQLTSARKRVTKNVHDAGGRLKDKLRAQVENAGLGRKVANAWRNRSFGREASYAPAALVWSKAPLIHAAFNQGVNIRTKNGEKYLAIPTEHVPRKPGGKRRTPLEVEDWLNGDLEFVPYDNGKPGGMLVAQKLTKSRNGKTWRKATTKRLKTGRKSESVIMFYLVPAARLKKKLDIDAAVKEVTNELIRNIKTDFGG